MADKENRSADVADHTRTHNALRELCRQRGTSLEEQSECGEDIVLWADAVMRELDADLNQAIAWVLDGDDEWSDAKDVLLSAMMARRRQDRKAAAPVQSAVLDEIAAEHGREVEKLLSGHYTAQKSPADSIAALTVDALAKAGAIWEKRIAKLEAEGVRLAAEGKKFVAAIDAEIGQMGRAERILGFLDAIETTEIVTADGSDRDVDPEGLGFSNEMLNLIEAISEDENDVWFAIAKRVLAGS